jgi:phosphotransferase system HPr-like phosphotransfer protein
MEKLSDIAHHFDCDIYIHHHRMKNYNFKLFGKKEYLNVKSMLSPTFIDAAHGEAIELLATGGRAREALEASARLIRELSPSLSV